MEKYEKPPASQLTGDLIVPKKTTKKFKVKNDKSTQTSRNSTKFEKEFCKALYNNKYKPPLSDQSFTC